SRNGFRELLEIQHIHNPAPRLEAYDCAVCENMVWLTQFLAKQDEGLTQALAGLLIGATAPKERRELLAGGSLFGTQCQIGEDSACLARGKPNRCGSDFLRERKPAKQAQANPNDWLHSN